MHGAIDYAGVFPPATLALEEAARCYADYRQGPDAWALGRFMLAARHLQPLADLLPEVGTSSPWSLGLTLGGEPATDLRAAAGFHAGAAGQFAGVTGVEGRASSLDEIRALLDLLPEEWDRFVELPLDRDIGPLISALAERGAGAKFRTGGVTADGFPGGEALLSALGQVVRAGVPFKCTAGLHHSVRGRYRLTYQPDSPTGMMYGFLNVFVAAALLGAGYSEAEVRPVLLEEDAAAFRADEFLIGWRDLTLDQNQVALFRAIGLQGFGACSFREPVDELLHLCQPTNVN